MPLAVLIPLLAAAWCLVFGSLGAWVAVQKRRHAEEGWLLGGVFGLIGMLIEALLPTGP